MERDRERYIYIERESQIAYHKIVNPLFIPSEGKLSFYRLPPLEAFHPGLLNIIILFRFKLYMHFENIYNNLDNKDI